MRDLVDQGGILKQDWTVWTVEEKKSNNAISREPVPGWLACLLACLWRSVSSVAYPMVSEFSLSSIGAPHEVVNGAAMAREGGTGGGRGTEGFW